MIKKIVLVIILLNIIVSCGKKSDPEYKADKYKYLNQKNII
mgnify:FL=1